MNRLLGLVAVATIVWPAALAAQRRPSNSMHTRSAEVYLDRAKSAARASERSELLNKALEALAQGMRTDADNPKVWFLAGQAYARLLDAAGADSCFDRAETLYPEYQKESDPERQAVWVNKYNAGVAAIQEGDFAKAIAEFELADRVYRGRPDAALSLGSLHARSGDLARAEAAYRTALDIIRGPAGQNLADDARAQWMEQEATAAGRLASILAQTGRPEDAIAVQRALVERQPGNAQAKSGLAAALAAAGRNEDAARVYAELLARDDLTDVDLFNAGVGLYQASQYEQAAQAFRKSLVKNPYSRDALFNLGQAIFADATDLEKKRQAAPESERASFAARLTALNTELAHVAEEIRAIDPSQRTPLMMLAQAQRSLGELSADPAAAQEWRTKVLATLEAAEAIPFDVSGVELTLGEGTAQLAGSLTNHKLPAGQMVALEFTLIAPTGGTVAVHRVEVSAPEPNARASFSFQVKTGEAIAGWKYRVAN